MSLPASDIHFIRPSNFHKRQLLWTGSALAVAIAALFIFWRGALLSDSYLPHAYCYLQKPALVWTHVTADVLIGLSYTAISILLAYLVIKARQDIPFRWMFLAFGLFIVACGATHFVEAVTVWIPVYVLSGAIKVFTAAASISTAVALPFTIPQVLTLVREARVSEERREALEAALRERNSAQAALQQSHQRLEQLVSERTAELAETNAALRVEVAERTRAQASLAKLALIVESSDDAIIGKDLKGTITSWNRGAEKIYGYKAQEVIGRPITVTVPSHRTDEITDIMSRVARGEHVDHYETERLTKAGMLLDVSLTVSPVYNSDRIIIGASAIARDVTAAKRAEQALQESEAQYRLLFDHNPVPMWVFDRKTLRFLAVNGAAVQHYGFSRDEFFRMTIEDIRPAKEAAALRRHLSEQPPGDRSIDLWKHQKKDGTLIDVEVTADGIQFRGCDAVLVLANDITERLKGEERLRQSQERFSKAFRSSPFGVTISTESEGRYLDVNPAFLRIMGYEREAVVGRTVKELNAWGDPQERRLMLEQLDSTGPVNPIEVHFRTKSGHVRLFELAAERIQLDDQRCVLAITHDVTEQRALEQQFRQAQKMEAIGRLAGGIAHDFNNMLGVIIGYTELAKDRLTPGHASQTALDEIRKASERAANLTRQLLAFSRQQVLEPRMLNLNSVVHNVSKMLLHMIGEDISLMLRPGEPLGSVRADLGQIEQVLMNLAVNARDAMPKGGKIVIETANVDLDEHYASQHQAVKPGSYVMLSVTDTGIGMDPATMARIFEPFFTTKEPGKGTGLGLSTVYGIVKQSEGHIWAYSEPGHGSTFKIYLPLAYGPAEHLGATKTGPALSIGAETVLIVEDDVTLRTLTSTLLESGGYRVLSAGDARSALALAQQYREEIDLLLTDVIMPGMTGPELVEKIRDHGSELKVLYMSGYAGNMMIQQGVVGPEMALLSKPFSRQNLLSKVRAVLDS